MIREYIYLGNMRIAMTNGSLDHPQVTPSQGPTGPLVLYFIHSDHLGTPRDVTDANQNIVWAMHQTPFGQATLDTEAIRMPMRFPGQYADIESGLNYNYFRDYDPTLGRYVESDPIGISGGLAAFAYAQASPGSTGDPTGLATFFGAIGEKGSTFGLSGQVQGKLLFGNDATHIRLVLQTSAMVTTESYGYAPAGHVAELGIIADTVSNAMISPSASIDTWRGGGSVYFSPSTLAVTGFSISSPSTGAAITFYDPRSVGTLLNATHTFNLIDVDLAPLFRLITSVSTGIKVQLTKIECEWASG